MRGWLCLLLAAAPVVAEAVEQGVAERGTAIYDAIQLDGAARRCADGFVLGVRVGLKNGTPRDRPLPAEVLRAIDSAGRRAVDGGEIRSAFMSSFGQLEPTHISAIVSWWRSGTGRKVAAAERKMVAYLGGAQIPEHQRGKSRPDPRPANRRSMEAEHCATASTNASPRT